MEEKIRQLEERISKLEQPTRLTDEWRKVLIAEGFLKYEGELKFKYLISGGDFVRLFINANNKSYVFDVIPSSRFKQVTFISGNKILLKSHGLEEDDYVTFYSTGELPTGVFPNNTYYVTNPTENDFQISQEIGGLPEVITGGGVGVHYFISNE